MATHSFLTNQILSSLVPRSPWLVNKKSAYAEWHLSSVECLPFVWASLKALRRSLKQRRNFKLLIPCLGRICFYILRSRLLVLCRVLIGAKTRMKIYTNKPKPWRILNCWYVFFILKKLFKTNAIYLLLAVRLKEVTNEIQEGAGMWHTFGIGIGSWRSMFFGLLILLSSLF